MNQLVKELEHCRSETRSRALLCNNSMNERVTSSGVGNCALVSCYFRLSDIYLWSVIGKEEKRWSKAGKQQGHSRQ